MARCTLWVPSTTSTHGARCRTSSRSFCAKQPATTIWRVGSASFQAFIVPSVPYNFLSAFSRMQHVLMTTTSALASSSIGSRPSCSNSPAIRSESCSFIWQPNVRTTYRRVTTLSRLARHTKSAGATRRRHPHNDGESAANCRRALIRVRSALRLAW